MNDVAETRTSGSHSRATGFKIAGAMFLLAASTAAFGWWQYDRYVNRSPLARIPVPGSATVQLDRPGQYLLCYEPWTATVFDGEVHTTYADGTTSGEAFPKLPSLQATIMNLATQQAVPIPAAYSTSWFEAELKPNPVRNLRPMFSFNASAPGPHQITLAYKSAPRDIPIEIAVVEQNFHQVNGTLLISLGIAIVLGLAALVTGFIAFTHRANAKRKRPVGSG